MSTKTYTFLTHHSVASVPTADITGSSLSQSLCTALIVLVKKGTEWSLYLEKIFTFSHLNKGWISANSLGKKKTTGILG